MRSLLVNDIVSAGHLTIIEDTVSTAHENLFVWKILTNNP